MYFYTNTYFPSPRDLGENVKPQEEIRVIG